MSKYKGAPCDPGSGVLLLPRAQRAGAGLPADVVVVVVVVEVTAVLVLVWWR